MTTQRILAVLTVAALGATGVACNESDNERAEHVSAEASAESPAVLSQSADEQVQRAILHELTVAAVVPLEPLEVHVTSGIADLEGTAPSLAARERAVRIAEGVHGVRAVVDRLRVNAAPRTDAAVAADVQRRLRRDAHVDHGLIVVSVTAGVVSLQGVVGSASEKRRAAHDAWVPGVTDVKSDGLVVKRWKRNRNLREHKYAMRSEQKAAIENAFEGGAAIVRADGPAVGR